MFGLRFVIQSFCAAIAVILVLPSEAISEGAKRPNPFATLEVGDVTEYEVGNTHFSYVFDGRDKYGYRQRRFPGRDLGGAAAETEWFDDLGRKIRREFADGLLITFIPYACFGVDGECIETAVYSDGRERVTKWMQYIDDGSIRFTTHIKDQHTGEWMLAVDGVYTFDSRRGTTVGGEWFDRVAGKTFSLRLISGPAQP